MRLFMKPENILCIEDFCYQHGGDVRNIQYADRSSIDLEPEPFKSCILEKLGAAKIWIVSGRSLIEDFVKNYKWS